MPPHSRSPECPCTALLRRLLFDGFCYKDRDDAIGLVLVLLIRRVCFDGDIPESSSLDWINYFSNPHRIDFGFVTNLNIRFSHQVVVPTRLFRRSTLRGYEDVTSPIDNLHQRSLSDRTRLPPSICHKDYWQTGVPQG